MTNPFMAVFYNPVSLFVFGACWGSFLNVVLYRWPLGKSIVSPGSACTTCGKSIAWYDNLPVLSWFLLRGKCRYCGASYSIRYALVEAFFGLVWAGCGLFWSTHPLAGASAAVGLTALIPWLWLLARHRRAPNFLLIAFSVGVGVHLGQRFLG